MVRDNSRLAQQILDCIAELEQGECVDLGSFIRFLSDQELCAVSAELEADPNVHEVIAGWRATARIKADAGQYADALRPTEGDFGPVRAE